MTRIAAAAAAAVTTALLLAGCSAGSGSDASAPMSDPSVASPETHRFTESDGSDTSAEMQAADEEASGDEASGGEPSDEERSVIRTGWIRLTVDDPIASADEIADLATGVRGRIDTRTETPGTDIQSARAQLVLRIPADDLDGVVEDLRELGMVDEVSLNASDVTRQRQDLDARIDALGASVDRLTELLAQATTTSDLIEIESELTTRQAELDSLTGQRDALVDQVDYSTLTVDLITEDISPEPKPDDFWSGLAAGWEALVGFGAGLLVVLGVLLPWIALLAAIAAVVVAIVVVSVRAGTRRREPDAEVEASTPDEERREA
ncbi:DUF4349 domain-containing protein [Agromyces sp. CFH 90414]|uniref:DUF4349 domain-containing protein n=1 Tax=Agromyces agglutinans TaxID=2662258 RepID=A0A6I2F835_9MICO|nr:DUF4349 domain-containing protein [Agromyces agglutinans]MRG60972.1 DUF4349 domain-containing protein [Agromyces agglutinans]